MNRIETSDYRTEIVKDLSTKNDIFAKIEIIGDSKVGKTTILSRIIKNTFKEEYIPTVGYEFNTYLIKVNEIVLKMQIWDMCGDKNYRSALFNLYRNAVVGILVYSVCSRESFNKKKKWILSLKKYALPWSKIILFSLIFISTSSLKFFLGFIAFIPLAFPTNFVLCIFLVLSLGKNTNFW